MYFEVLNVFIDIPSVFYIVIDVYLVDGNIGIDVFVFMYLLYVYNL